MIHFLPGLPQFIFRNTAAIVILSSDAAYRPASERRTCCLCRKKQCFATLSI